MSAVFDVKKEIRAEKDPTMMQAKTITPDIAWCARISQQRGVTTRCPFATVETCPRYYESRDVLGKLHKAAELKAEDDAQLRARWKKHPIASKLSEEPTHASPGGYYANFCPEVLLDTEGLSAVVLSGFADDVDRDSRHRMLAAQRADKMDWRWRWADLYAQHYSDCPYYAVLLQNHEPAGKPTKPIGFHNSTLKE